MDIFTLGDGLTKLCLDYDASREQKWKGNGKQSDFIF